VNIGGTFNLIANSCSKIFKKKKSKSPAVVKARPKTRWSPYKQNNTWNTSMYQKAVDLGFKNPVTNRNAAILSKGKKWLINSTFWNEDKSKISTNKTSSQKGENKLSERLKMDKKFK